MLPKKVNRNKKTLCTKTEHISVSFTILLTYIFQKKFNKINFILLKK